MEITKEEASRILRNMHCGCNGPEEPEIELQKNTNLLERLVAFIDGRDPVLPKKPGYKILRIFLRS